MSTLEEPTGQAPATPLSLSKPQQPVPPQPGPQYGQPQYGQQYGGQPPYAPAPYGQPYQPVPFARPLGPAGKVRSTWAVIGLSIITLGIYSLYYQFAVHQEMKDHSGEGIGGVIALILVLFTGGLVTSFVLPHEVGNLYARQGRPRPVTAATGLWVLLGSFIIVGPLVWLIKTNGALNAYWRSLGVR